MPFHRLAILIGLLFLLVPLPRAHAAPESYVLSVDRPLVLEGDSVTATLTVSSASYSTYYEFLFQVVDSTNTLYTASASHTTGPSESSFAVSRVFAADFASPASTKFVGRYNVYVDQVAPTSAPFIQSATFDVLLTDRASYQRTEDVRIVGAGYSPAETVTIRLVTAGTPVTGFPRQLTSDLSGRVETSWSIPVSAALGTYSLTADGTLTSKSVPDAQDFQVNSAIIIVSGLGPGSATYQRTETVVLSFQALYPNGARITTGSVSLTITRPDGSSAPPSIAAYNQTTGRFSATIKLVKDDQRGVWIVRLNPGSLDDGYGNTGPAAIVTAQFSVGLAILSVTPSVSATSVSADQTLTISSQVTYPDSAPLIAGSVLATIRTQDGRFVTEVSLRYDPLSSSWRGSYTSRSGDPAGVWSIAVSASDSSSTPNAGQGSITVNFAGSPLVGFTTSLFIAAGVGIGAAVLVTIWWARRKITKKEVKLDLKFVETEVHRIEEKDFFKHISEQVEKRKKPSDRD